MVLKFFFGIAGILYAWEREQFIYIYICIYIYIYKVNEDCEYPKNECSMHGYLIQNIPADQTIFIYL